MARKKKAPSALKLEGHFRVNIQEDGRVVGDSGWKKNVITQDLIERILYTLGSAPAILDQATHVALGSGGAVAYLDLNLTGEHLKSAAKNRMTMDTSIITSGVSGTATVFKFFATFPADSFTYDGNNNATINNIGIFPASDSGDLLAGNTYQQSTVASNQIVTATYNISLGQS